MTPGQGNRTKRGGVETSLPLAMKMFGEAHSRYFAAFVQQHCFVEALFLSALIAGVGLSYQELYLVPANSLAA